MTDRAQDEASRVDEPPAKAPAKRPGWRRRLWLWMRPAFYRAWINIRAWVPFLMNPFERKRLVKYRSRENRVGLTWTVELPNQCWECGATSGLEGRNWTVDVRSFEYPIAVVAGTLALILVVLVIGWLLPWWATLGLLITTLVVGTAVFWIKSWSERVVIAMSACPDHSAEATMPDVVVYDEELFVYLPTSRLAKAATAELTAQRRTAGRWADES